MPKPTIRFYALPEIHNVQLVHGLNVQHHFPRHSHNSFSFGVVERGRRVIEIRDQTVTILAGECFILNPSDPHACQSEMNQTHDYWVLSISPDATQTLVADITGQPELCPYFPQYVIRDQPLFEMIKTFADAARQADDRLRQESVLLEIVAYSVTHYAQTPAHPRPVSPHRRAIETVRKYLEQHLEELVRLDDLAAVAHISPFHLTRLFQQEVGMPPYEYLVQIRLKRAQTLLKSGATISDAAYNTGFADQSHFTRFFKRHVGITPGEYRRAYGY